MDVVNIIIIILIIATHVAYPFFFLLIIMRELCAPTFCVVLLDEPGNHGNVLESVSCS